jgi:hypothetical protein
MGESYQRTAPEEEISNYQASGNREGEGARVHRVIVR